MILRVETRRPRSSRYSRMALNNFLYCSRASRLPALELSSVIRPGRARATELLAPSPVVAPRRHPLGP